MIPDYFLTVRLSDSGEPRRASDEEPCFQGVPLKRATGLEPATSSLEGWRSTN
jgi:hypothetical protein